MMKNAFYFNLTVCNFQYMKTPVELNSLLSKFFCYITWFVISPDQTRLQTTCKRGLYVKSHFFFETIGQRFKNYKLLKAVFVLKIFFLTFWSCKKSGLISKVRLISKFMTLEPGSQSNTIHILPNISQSKGNQAI